MINPLLRRTVVFSALVALAGCGGSSSSYGSNNNQGTSVVMSPANGTTLPNGTVGTSYTQTFTVVSGGTAPYVLTPTGIPAGLAWSSTPSSGTLAGTPTQVGSATFQVTITDSTGQSAQVGYPLTIVAANGVLTISPSTLPGGTVGTAYNASIVETGGVAPFTFTTQGNLPPGITLGPSASGMNGQATFSGTPVASGNYTFTVNVHDSQSTPQTGSISYTISIP